MATQAGAIGLLGIATPDDIDRAVTLVAAHVKQLMLVGGANAA
jgi:hypothetical protein